MRRSDRGLIDRGANGCIFGNNMRPVGTHRGTTHVHGLKNHTIRDLPLMQAGGVVPSNRGPIILILNQAAKLDDSLTILSPGQMEHYRWTINEKSPLATGGETPSMESPEGYRIPLAIKHGLPYVKLRPFTDHEWQTLPHIMATSPFPWDPSCLDSKIDDEWYNQDPSPSAYFQESNYDAFGDPNPLSDADSDDPANAQDRPVARSDVHAFATAVISDELAQARSAFVSTRSQRLQRRRKRAQLQEARLPPPPHSPSPSTVGEKIIVETVSEDGDSDGEAEPPELLVHDFSSSESEADGRGQRKPTRRPRRRATKTTGKSPKIIVETVSEDGDSDREAEPPELLVQDFSSSESEAEGGGRGQRKPTRRHRSRATKTTGKSPSSSPSDDDCPHLAEHKITPPSECPDSSSSSEADSDSDAVMGRPSFNSKAKTATGIENPSKTWAIPNVKKREYKKMKGFFPGASVETIKKTFEATTQYATRGAVEGTTLRQQIRAPNPVLNVRRRNEDVATDTLHSSTPAAGNGSTKAQFFIGRLSKYRSVVPIGNSDKDFVHALMEEIRKRGAMNRVISDRAKAEISARVKDVLRTYNIGDWQSEPHQQRQNYAERGFKNTKEWTNNVLNMSGAPASMWLFALIYVCFLQNHLAYKSLGWRTPIEWLLGYTPDISVLLQFVFYQPVLYAMREPSFPEDSTELVGRIVGISEDIGHGMTFKILIDDKGNTIDRAVVRSALGKGPYRNLRALRKGKEDVDDEPDEELTPFEKGLERDIGSFESDAAFGKYVRGYEEVLRSPHDVEDGDLPKVDIKNLAGRTFITTPDDDGEQFRATVVEAQATGERTADHEDVILKFKCKHGDRLFEEVMSYNKMLEWCDRDLDKDDMYRLESIASHRKAKLSTTKGQWEVLVEWASGIKTWNCLNLTFSDDPMSVSLYALRNKLLELPGWKRCRPYVKNAKRFGRMINQAKLRNYRRKPVYKYGQQVPRNHEEAVFIDEKNGNTAWQESEKLELNQLNEYETFNDLGLGAPRPEGYTRIPCHMVYDFKHDGRFKSRFCAGGHRTPTPESSVYSGVVSIQGIRIVTLLAELNDLELWSTDVGNAYLESYTTEKVCFTAGGEFGELEGHTLVIIKALYGLKSSGKCWHDKLFEVLWSMGFRPSKAEADIWMRAAGDHYEYVACYVDDLLIVSRDPQKIITGLEAKPHKFKLKGTGPVKFHLGCDYFRDENGTLCVGPKTYIERLALQYKSMFGVAPTTTYRAPLEKNDHPELDTSSLLNEDGITQYQSLIGAMQWTITLGRFDVSVAVMTMSGFRVAPRVGHLERLRRIVGYLYKKRNGYVRVRTGEPDFSDLPPKRHDWSHTVYGDVKEVIPEDAPTPLGKRLVHTVLNDANLHHDMVTGRSVTGILHFLNQTPIDWYAKKQATAEAATYGSEFVSARTATEQILAMRTTLRYLGVEVHGPTRLFGDNSSVVTSGSVPDSPLKKRHHALSYHVTREAIASGAMDFQHVPGDANASDILSKHWAYSAVWPLLKSVLFWPGDTGDLFGAKDTDSPIPDLDVK